MALADLHTHTTASDGRYSPPTLVERAAFRGLKALAITDHDTISGLPLAMHAAQKYGIRLIPGVELSTYISGVDVHLLAYGFDMQHSGLKAHLVAFRQARIDRTHAIVERLRSLGARITFEDVQNRAKGTIGRPHIAQALVESGFVESINQAFSKYLADGAVAFVPKETPAPRFLIDLVHDASGIVSLAHPAEHISDRIAEGLMADGLDAVEVIHPSHSIPEITERWQIFARKHQIKTSGGSDFHGYREGEDEYFGRIGIPLEKLDELLA